MQLRHLGLRVPATIAFALLVTFQSCKKNDLHDLNGTTGTYEIDALREAVAISTGTPPDKVVYLKNEKQFVVDGDGYVTLQDALLRFGNTGMERPGVVNAATQMMSYYPVDTSKVYRIKLYADASVPAVWITALDLAISHWNQTGSKVQMQRTAASDPYTTTLVTTNNKVSSTVASAAYPDYYRNPGNKITINTYYNDLPALKKEFAITHELGHTVGFSHTNETTGYLISGTPASDPASVMNSTVVDWAGYSYYDLVAFKTVYPVDSIPTTDTIPPPPPPPPPTNKGKGKNK